ncbi:MAG: aminotransferase class IV [Chloroflexota bacterium]|nr:aminotransferase class IV [Chloroflexota bacterium]
MSVYYVNGDFVDAADAAIPASDLALLRGYGVFDFLRTYGGKPFQLGAHLRRLITSAALLDLHCPWDIEELDEIVMETLRRNTFAESGIRLIVTGGDSPNGFMPAGESRLVVMATPMNEMAARYYEHGADVVTVEVRRDMPEAKTINYIPAITAQKQALRFNANAIEAIYTVDGKVVEGTRSNTFIFKDGTWITPASDVLLGITRAEVIKLIKDDGRLELREITKAEYQSADEMILTSTTKEVMPVVNVDDVPIGSGAPGENTRKLMRAWRRMTEGYAAMDGYL